MKKENMKSIFLQILVLAIKRLELSKDIPDLRYYSATDSLTL